MRAFVLVASLVACEQPKTEPRAPEPAPAPPPGPRLIEQAPPPAPPPVRTLPSQELDEVRAILDGKGTYDPNRVATNPNLAVDPSWDARRVKLVAWKQEGQRIELRGEAQAIDDMVQLVKRLAASVYFTDVTPMSGERRASSTIYDFEVRMKAPKADPDAPVLTETFTK